VINKAFSISDADRVWARKVVAAFADNPDSGTVAIDGRMVDRPHLTQARRLLALAPEL
jgi:citrate lyase subunit beta / citryl-CoA lyase